MPSWFSNALIAAQHADKIMTWPWWARLLHKWFISYNCPACKEWKRLGGKL